jgi:alpha-beta hydrolase superfamily lysophospholipase
LVERRFVILGTSLIRGLRVVAIDLPAHGRSGGVYSPSSYALGLTLHSHSFVTDIYAFPRVIREAISFITKYDNPSPPDLQEKRRVFVGGGSLGGWASLEYGLNPNENVAGIIAWVPNLQNE